MSRQNPNGLVEAFPFVSSMSESITIVLSTELSSLANNSGDSRPSGVDDGSMQLFRSPLHRGHVGSREVELLTSLVKHCACIIVSCLGSQTVCIIMMLEELLGSGTMDDSWQITHSPTLGSFRLIFGTSITGRSGFPGILGTPRTNVLSAFSAANCVLTSVNILDNCLNESCAPYLDAFEKCAFLELYNRDPFLILSVISSAVSATLSTMPCIAADPLLDLVDQTSSFFVGGDDTFFFLLFATCRPLVGTASGVLDDAGVDIFVGSVKMNIFLCFAAIYSGLHPGS